MTQRMAWMATIAGVLFLSTAGAVQAKPAKYKWMRGTLFAESQDCTAADKSCTVGAYPDPAKCDSSAKEQVAVCWDNIKFINTQGCDGSPVWCTYKTTKRKNCAGGGAPGFAFECRKQ